MESMNRFEARQTVAEAFAAFCVGQGVCAIFAVSGGGCAELYSALSVSGIKFLHCRREDSCVYAALEASRTEGRPAACCVTTGEAVSKAASAIASARARGAHLLLLSGHSDLEEIGRAAIQPTTLETMPSDFYRSGPLFDYGRILHSGDELPWTLDRLQLGFQCPTGFVAHVAVPRRLQGALVRPPTVPPLKLAPAAPAPAALDYCARVFSTESFAVLAGTGAVRSEGALRRLLTLSGARVLITPSAMGLAGGPTIGLGGIRNYYPSGRPARLLVLGSRLGQASTLWDPELLPRKELIHVDLDHTAFGGAFRFPTYAIQAEISLYLSGLLAKLEAAGDAPLCAAGA